MNYACYCLLSETGSTYVGSTNNLERRLRQHNCELVGGAKATKGKTWKRILSVSGFPDHTSALQFEWAWKYWTRKTHLKSAVERRCAAVVVLLNKDHATSKAEPFETYENPLCLHVEDQAVLPWLRDKEMKYGVLIE